MSLTGRERTRPDPAKRRPVRPRSDCILMDGAGRQSSEPAPAGIVRRARRFYGREPSGHKPQGLDHFPAVGPPQPRAPSNKRVRHGHRQGAARERHAIRAQTCADLGQQPVCARRLNGRIDEPGERRRELHGSNIGVDAALLSRLIPAPRQVVRALRIDAHGRPMFAPRRHVDLASLRRRVSAAPSEIRSPC